MKKLLSIIIPTYNSSEKLVTCLNSIVSANYDNCEIIVIDDGSSDDTKYKVEDFAKNYKNISYIYQTNSGVSSARNLGIANAIGDYLSFVDADDSVTEDFFYVFDNYVKNSAFTICPIGSYKFDEKYHCYTIKPTELCTSMVNSQYNNKNKYFRFYLSHVTSKFFKREIIVGNSIIFDSILKNGEDLLFNLQYAALMSDIQIIDVNIYNYNYNASSYSLAYNKCFINDQIELSKALDKFQRSNPLLCDEANLTMEKYCLYLGCLKCFFANVNNGMNIYESRNVLKRFILNEKYRIYFFPKEISNDVLKENFSIIKRLAIREAINRRASLLMIIMYRIRSKIGVR